jgi:hypothetical protein
MNTSKVYIPHHLPRFDYSPARVFGEIVPVTERAHSFNRESQGQMELVASIQAAANDFSEYDDYVLLSGVALNTTLFIQMLAARGIHRVRCLVWSTNDSSYVAGVYEGPQNV